MYNLLYTQDYITNPWILEFMNEWYIKSGLFKKYNINRTEFIINERNIFFHGDVTRNGGRVNVYYICVNINLTS